MSLALKDLHAVVGALQRDLVDARLQQVRAVPDPDDAVLLQLRTPGHSHDLRIDVTAGRARLHRTTRVPRQPPEPPAFVMLLRKRVVGARFITIAAHEDDRIVHLAFDAHEGPLRLTAELTGRHGNLFLLDEDNRILGALLPNKSQVRDLRPGATWHAPTPPDPPPGGVALPDSDAPIEARIDDAFDDDHRTDELRSALLATLRTALRRARRRRNALERDAANVAEADRYRVEGELLQQAFGRVERGATSVDVLDFYDPDQRTVTLELDPAIDLKANIDRRFRRYRKYARGADTVAARTASTERAIAQLEALREEIDGADDLEELAARIEAHPDVRERQRPRHGRRNETTERQPYHRYEASDGTPILVGRGSADNDALTFRVARGRDIWMHAADVPGSHVIVRVERDAPSRTALEEAALLAAHFSKARGDSVVTVRYTERKHVRKPRGAGPGRVSLAGGRTLDVRDDDPRLSRLLRPNPET